MYIPKSFALNEPDEITQLIEQNSFGTLVTHGPGGLQASHLPFEYIAGENKLVSHLARANSQWRDFPAGEVLVIFQGPHAYISPSWYESELSVPTWNYVAVHAYGKAEVLEDDLAAKALLERLVTKYESGMPHPWRLEAPEEWQANLRQAIVAFEIKLSRVEGKAKMSQNRNLPDVQGTVNGLERSGQSEVADWVRRMNHARLEAATSES